MLLPALGLLFLISGACGLIYQVLWLRLLGLVFGVTVYAASTVWASFMAGLALGSFVGGRLGDRVRSPLIWFGAVEIFVGLSALSTPLVLDVLQGWYAQIHDALPRSVGVVTLARGLMSFLVLLVPTMLMGATLPLIVRSALVRGGELGTKVGVLYGTNTAGAIAGTLAAGLILIPSLGIGRTFQLGAALNAAVGLVAVLIGLRGRKTMAIGEKPSVPPVPDVDAPADRPGEPAFTRYTVLAVFAVSGFATLALEVIWFRAIVLVARPTVYTFAVMLATVLFGIAAGSYLVSIVMRRQRNWLAWLAVIEVAMGVAALTSLAALAQTPDVERMIAPYVAAVLPSYLSHALAASLPVILPTTLLMGIAYPIGIRLWVGGENQSRRLASRLGVFNSMNLVGAIFGSLTAGFILLPVWGSQASLVATATLIFVSGFALLMLALRGNPVRVLAASLLVPAFAVLAVRTTDPFMTFLRLRFPNLPVASHEEAVEGTVSVHGDGPGRYMLVLDGNHQANDTGPMLATHRRISLLALAIHPEPRDVLVVGLGGGATPGAVSRHEGVDLDVVELSSAVARASKFFAHANHDLLTRPNVRLILDDGRNHLALTKKKYDVLTADIILPIHAGSNNVYSEEYFKLVRRALKPGGLAMQWASGTEAEYKTIARTFRSVFPHATVWADGSLLVGTVEPLKLRESDFNWKLQLPNHRAGLAELGVRSFEDLLGLYAAGPEELQAFLGPGPILTDDRPLAEYFLSLPRDRRPNLSSLRGDVTRHVQ
jgi:spermidine synthase